MLKNNNLKDNIYRFILAIYVLCLKYFVKHVDVNLPVTLNPLTTNVPHHIETSQLICIGR